MAVSFPKITLHLTIFKQLIEHVSHLMKVLCVIFFGTVTLLKYVIYVVQVGSFPHAG